MLNKLLIISGSTATGKTAFAEILAKKFNGSLISADSRQVYKGLNIGTGKDHHPNTPISLIDVVTIDKPFSAYDFTLLAKNEIKNISFQRKLPILVGGTGFYISSLISPEPFENYNFRSNIFFPVLNFLPIKILQGIYQFTHPFKYQKLNNSEKYNPQRLIKRILAKENNTQFQNHKYDIFHLHLTAPNSIIHHQIDLRIQQRLKAGLLAEISSLLKIYSWQAPGLKTIAYQEFQEYFSKKLTLDQAITNWAIHEKQYVKRQKTFFAKLSPKITFDITQKNWQQKAIKQVDKWYN